MNIIIFIMGIIIFAYATKELLDIKSVNRHSVKLEGKITNGMIEAEYEGKKLYKKISFNDMKGSIDVFINPNNGMIYTEFELIHYNKYRRNTIILYLLDTIFILPPLLIWAGINNDISWLGTIIFVIYLLLILLATKTLVINTSSINGDLLNESDYEKKVVSNVLLNMFNENIKTSKIIPLSFEKYENKYKLAKSFIISSSIIAFTIIACMLIIESIKIPLAIILLIMIVAIIFLVSPKDEGLKQDIIIKNDSLLWFITHIDNKSSELYEWYNLYKINSVRKYDLDDKTFIVKGDLEKMTKRPGFHSKFINTSIDEIRIPRVFEEEEFIIKKLDELTRESNN